MKNNRKNLHVYYPLSPHMVCDAQGQDSGLSFSLAQALPKYKHFKSLYLFLLTKYKNFPKLNYLNIKIKLNKISS